MDSKDLAQKIARLDQMLDQKLGLRKGTLSRRADKAGRRLPKHVRQGLKKLDEAQMLSAHPTLSRMLDAPALSKAYSQAAAHLSKIDPKERRKDTMLGLAGGLAFNLLLLGALLIGVLLWQGIL